MDGPCATRFPPFCVSLQLALFKLYDVPLAWHQRGFWFERTKIPFITDHPGLKMFAVPIIYVTLQQRDKNEVNLDLKIITYLSFGIASVKCSSSNCFRNCRNPCILTSA